MAYSPSDLSGRRCWEASTLGLSNGAPVATWTDYGATAKTFTGSGGQRPTMVTSGINSVAAVDFNGTANILIANETPTWGDFTVTVIYKQLAGSPGTFGRVFSKTATTGMWIGRSAHSTVTEYAGGCVQSATPYGQPVNVGDNSVAHVITSRRSGGVHMISVDGRRCVTQFTVGTTSTNSDAYVIGAETDSSSFGNVRIAAVFVSPNAESNDNLDLLYAYLGTKYGITTYNFTPNFKNYIFASFWDMDAPIHQQQLRIVTSDDGIAWLECPSLWRPPTTNHVCPNPALMIRGTTYYLAHCNASIYTSPIWDVAANHMTFATSTDGLTYTLLADIDYSSSFTTIFAGSWFQDPADSSWHYIMAASVLGYNDPSFQFDLYEIHPTNAGWTTWSAPVMITGSGLVASKYDPTIIKRGSTYYLFYANISGGTFQLASSTSLLTGYTAVSQGGFGSSGDEPYVVYVNGHWFFVTDTGGFGSQEQKYDIQTGTAWDVSSMGACFGGGGSPQPMTLTTPPLRAGAIIPALGSGHFSNGFVSVVR